jgi:hypothetical protein
MVKFADSRAEVEGRNRELRRLTNSASENTKRLFKQFTQMVADSQVGDRAVDPDSFRAVAESLRGAAEAACAEAEVEMIQILSRTHRKRALDIADVEGLRYGPSHARFAWILSVAGSDDAEAAGTLKEYLQAASTWFAESLIRFVVNPAESSLLGIQPAARHSRMEAGSTRFRWICTLFAEGVDEWASAQGGEAATIFGGGRTRSLAEAIVRTLPLPDESVLEDMHPKLVKALTASRRPSSAFAQLVEGNGPEVTPLVAIDGVSMVGNASALVFGLEIVLVAGIQTTLGSEAQGDAFEFVTQYIADRLLPLSVYTARDSFVSDTMSGSTGDEIDLDIFGKALQVVVEAKSHLPAKDAAAAAASYEELLKANKQLLRRVGRLQEGKWIRRSRVSRSDFVGGLIVTLHDYTQQAWKPESMTESGSDAFHVLPIQAFAMALGCVESPTDFADFLKLRAAIGSRQVSGGDELEIILGWISGTRAADVPAEPGAKIQFRPYSIGTDSLLTAEWTNRNEWRRYLLAASRAIHR